MKPKPWTGSTALIVGASSGLGAHLAAELATRCQNLFLIARGAEKLQTFSSTLQKTQPKAHIETIVADASELDSLQQAAKTVAAQTDKIDLLINAVGRSDRGRLLDLDDQKLKELFTINVLTALHGVRVFHEPLRASRGTIVNIGSLSSKFAPRFLGGYSTTKFALAAVTQQLRLELADDGIHVMLACPGPIQRDDSASRYAELAKERNLPSSANAPGGGAKLKGLDPQQLTDDILRCASQRRPELILPAKARLLLILQSISPLWGDYLLRRSSG